MKPSRRFALSLCAGLTLIASACQSTSRSASHNSAAPSAAPASVRVEVCTGYSASFLPYLVARQDGDITKIEQQFHTKFEDITNLTGPNCIAAFTSGSVDLFGSTLANDALAQKSNLPARAIVEPFYGSALFLVGAKKYESTRRTDVTKYSGASVGTLGSGTTTSIYLKLLGAHADATYHEVNVGASVAALTPALQIGRIDAFVSEIISTTTALTTGAGYLVDNLNTPDAESLVGHFTPSANWAVSQKFIDTYPALTQAFVTAQIRALSLIRAAADDPAKVAALTPPTFTVAHGSSWPVVWSLLRNSFENSTGAVDQATLDASAKFLTTYGPLKPADTVPGSLVNNSFVTQAYKALGMTPGQPIPATLSDVKPSG